MGNFMTTVGKDQIHYFKDSLTPKFLIPNILAVLMIIGGIVGLIVIGSKRADSKNTQSEQTNYDTTVTTTTLKMSAGVIASFSVLGTGILTLIVTGIVLAVRHPRAAAEQMVATAAVDGIGGVIASR